MPKTVQYVRTLVYYDAPQVFVAADVVGTNYLSLLVSQSGEGDRYVLVPVSEGRLSDFQSGRVDLRSVFTQPETDTFYSSVVPVDGTLSTLSLAPISSIDESWLPDEGFFYETQGVTESDALAQEAISRNRAILHLALSPPEARTETKIDSYKLAEALGIFQSVVKYAYKRAMATLTPATRRLLGDPENYGMDVFAFSPGSFTIHFQSKIPADLVGYVNIVHAFRTVDDVTELLQDPERAVERIQVLRGHFASSYKRLLEYVVENNASLSYAWTTPEIGSPQQHRIPIGKAAELYELLSQVTDIGVEAVTLTGTLIKANTKTGAWTLRSIDDGREYHGRIKAGAAVSLKGMVLGENVYRFICEETITGVVGTGEEKKDLALIRLG